MNKIIKLLIMMPVAIGVCIFPALGCAGAHINKDINISDEKQVGTQSTVNGNIRVGKKASISGALETVNGTIRVGDHTQLAQVSTVNGRVNMGDHVTTEDVSCVNGPIYMGKKARINGEVSTVNGDVELNKGSRVSHDVSSINGAIRITGADIDGNLATVNGDISVNDTRVQGNVIVRKPKHWPNDGQRHEPKIIIGPNSKIFGEIILEQRAKLLVSKSAEIGGIAGAMSMDDVVWYTGSKP